MTIQKFALILAMGIFSTGGQLTAGSMKDHVPNDAAEAVPLGVGETLPDSKVRTLDGEMVGLHDLVSGQPAVFIFYRGGWCPYCTRHLSALREVIPALTAKDVQVFAVSPDRPEKLRETSENHDLNYTLISDSQVNAIRDLGLAFRVPNSLVETYKTKWGIDLEGDSGETHHILPVPAIFFTDADGKIIYQYTNVDYKTRLDPKNLLTSVEANI